MTNLLSYQEFMKNFKRLAGMKTEKKEYLIRITIESSNLMLEHESLSKFRNSTNVYLYHTERITPPVRAHYHVYPSNGKNEIYAVNIDGTAHHKSNRGFLVPKKEAEELKALGVAIKDNRIIENVAFLNNGHKQLVNESIEKLDVTIYLKFEE